MTMLPMLRKAALTVAVFVTSLLAPLATAQVINFDDVDTSAGSVYGAAAESYLAGYGITFSTSAPVQAVIENNPWWLSTPSSPNTFGAIGSASLFSYTLSFSSLLDSLSFTRVGTVQAWMSAWSATAYSATNTVLGSVGESNLIGYSNAPAQTFSLSWAGIDHVVFTDNAMGFAGTNARFDNLTLTAAVPEPEIYAMLGLGLGLLGWVGRRRKLQAA